MTNYDEYVANKLKNPEFRCEYDALDPEFAIIHAMIAARNNSGRTQKQLAERTGIAQSEPNWQKNCCILPLFMLKLK